MPAQSRRARRAVRGRPVFAQLGGHLRRSRFWTGGSGVGLAARQGQQLLGEARAAVHALLQPAEQPVHVERTFALVELQRRVRSPCAAWSAACAVGGRVGQELALRLGGAGQAVKQAVEGGLQWRQLLGQGRGQWLQAMQVALLQFQAERGDRPQALADGPPRQRPSAGPARCR